MTNLTKPVWKNEHQALLGAISDRAIADIAGVDHTLVRKRRMAAGIQPYNFGTWTSEMTAALGTISDAQLVTKFKLRITPDAVAARRLSMGIPNITGKTKKVVWSDTWLGMLGDVPDRDVARLVGCHVDTVAAKRRMIGKPKFVHR
jgi:hypothetical protein